MAILVGNVFFNGQTSVAATNVYTVPSPYIKGLITACTVNNTTSSDIVLTINLAGNQIISKSIRGNESIVISELIGQSLLQSQSIQVSSPTALNLFITGSLIQ